MTAKRPTIASSRPIAPSDPSSAAPIRLGRNANASVDCIVRTSTAAVGSSASSVRWISGTAAAGSPFVLITS